MSNKKLYNIEGQKFNRLTVLIEDFGRNQNKLVMCKCSCDCGKIVTISRSRLMSGHTKSCGCLNIKKSTDRINTYRDSFYSKYDYTNGVLSSVYQYYKRNAKRRSIEFDISKDSFINKLDNKCKYCGVSNSMSKETPSGIVRYNGVDRVNSSIGYTETNTVPCCKHCNTAKASMDIAEFKEWIDRVHKHLN